MDTKFNCRICGSDNNRKFSVKEMQFGTGEIFEYYECIACGCLQISQYPSDMSKYYPSKYFSFASPHDGNFLKEYLNTYRDKASMGRKNFLGDLLKKKLGIPTFIKKLKVVNTKFDDKIIDIGCGSGKLLYRMGNTGFPNLLGIDPYIEKDISYKNGVKILKKSLCDLDEKFDLAILHHSLEHMCDQHQVFKKLNDIVRLNKHVIIGIPLASSWSWRYYGINWVHLDAPRHFYLYTNKSFRLISEKYGFEIVDVMYDSLASQFLGSEQYIKGISLYAHNSYLVSPKNSIFTDKEIKEYEKRAEHLNIEGEGDRACFFLRKVKDI